MTDINERLKLRKERVVDEVIELLDGSYGYSEQKLEIVSMVLAKLAKRDLDARFEEMTREKFSFRN